MAIICDKNLISAWFERNRYLLTFSLSEYVIGFVNFVLKIGIHCLGTNSLTNNSVKLFSYRQ